MKLSRAKKLLLLGIILVLIDQIIKILVKTNMFLGQHIDVIGQWFKLLFIENEGFAFGWRRLGQILSLCLPHLSRCGAHMVDRKDVPQE